MSSNLMDTAPGGETSQYESIKTVDVPTDSQSGTLGKISGDGDVGKDKAEHGEKTAENIRYGQGISESGFGGKTNETEGIATSDGHGKVEAQPKEEETKQSRREQQYGSMPPIGA